jgi:hypothetical protein
MCIAEQSGGNCSVCTERAGGFPMSGTSQQNPTDFFRRGSIEIILAETLAEQKRIKDDEIDAIVLKTIATVLTSFGIYEDDKPELRADLSQLRRWRKSVEQAKIYAFRAVITIILTGALGAMWLGIKTVFGK